MKPGHTEASIVIDAPRAEVWRLTNDVPAWPQLFSEYSAATVLERAGDTVRFRLTTRPDANGDEWSWVSERTTDQDTYTVEARRVETGAFQHMRIHWSYHVVEGGTEMRWVQDFEMRPDAPVNTEWMTAHICANSLLQQSRIQGLIEEAVALTA
ncbi:MAG: polyketide cyclase [Catenulispora sp. 13_1_20CM_3_70_7]|nr:MAG: polyketide cyclase [Catenulispora sp. 13_1_20CM_3_70_7]